MARPSISSLATTTAALAFGLSVVVLFFGPTRGCEVVSLWSFLIGLKILSGILGLLLGGMAYVKVGRRGKAMRNGGWAILLAISSFLVDFLVSAYS